MPDPGLINDIILLEKYAGELRRAIFSLLEKRMLWSREELRLHLDMLISQTMIDFLEAEKSVEKGGLRGRQVSHHKTRPSR